MIFFILKKVMIQVASIFTGVGGFELGLPKKKYEIILHAEHDPSRKIQHASYVLSHHFPDVPNIGNLEETKWADQPDFDVLVGGAPCFVVGTKVYTLQGYKNIENIEIGDFVLTHRNRFRCVTKIKVRKSDTVKLKACGILPTGTTKNHLYYTRKRSKRVWDKQQKRMVYTFSDPMWVRVDELSKDHYIGIPINSDTDNKHNLTERMCWMMGRYAVGGKIERNLSAKELTELFKGLDLDFEATLNLPVQLAKSFLDGCILNSGCQNSKGLFSIVIANLNLGLGLSKLISKIHGIGSSISYSKTANGGRYTIKFHTNVKNGSRYKIIDGLVWYPFESVETKLKEEPVYCLTVEEDCSYTANNAVVHNCQDFSEAGKRKGFRGIRGTMFFEYARALREKQPKHFIFENVKGLLTHDNSQTIKTMFKIFSEVGYSFDFELLRASNFGPAQNRDRIFIVGVRNDCLQETYSKIEGGGIIGLKPCPSTNSQIKLEHYELSKHSFGEAGGRRVQFNQSDYYTDAEGWNGQGVFDDEGDEKSIIAYSKSTRRYHIDHRIRLDGAANTLNTGDGCRTQSSANFAYSKNFGLRKLTPLECERLQGWPCNWTKYGKIDGKIVELKDSIRYKLIGNGVVPQVVNAVVENLMP